MSVPGETAHAQEAATAGFVSHQKELSRVILSFWPGYFKLLKRSNSKDLFIVSSGFSDIINNRWLAAKQRSRSMWDFNSNRDVEFLFYS